VSGAIKKTPKYAQIIASIREVGIVEPPVVARDSTDAGKYLLLDGHLRIDVLKDMGETEVVCLVSTDDEAFTYNKRVIHQPAAFRGEANNGVPGLTCAACHSDRNFTLSVGEASYQSIPGHPRWALAPLEMAWEGKSVGDICRQIKDPTRNGGRSLALLHEHIANDDLVRENTARD
jgi:ParB-like nuclease domain